MKRAKPEHIGDILAKMKKNSTLGVNLEQARIWENWDEVAGANLARHCRPHSVKDGQLRVVADSPVWMHKISYIKWDLLRRINRMANKELVSDVFFMLASDEKEAAESEPDDNRKKQGARKRSAQDTGDRK